MPRVWASVAALLQAITCLTSAVDGVADRQLERQQRADDGDLVGDRARVGRQGGGGGRLGVRRRRSSVPAPRVGMPRSRRASTVVLVATVVVVVCGVAPIECR